MKKIYFIVIAIIAFLYIIHEVRKKKFSVKESFWWVIAAIIMLVLSVFPYSIDHIAKFLNVSYPPTILLVLCVIFLLFINFKSSKKIAEHQEKIIELSQRLAILEFENKEKNKKSKV